MGGKSGIVGVGSGRGAVAQQQHHTPPCGVWCGVGGWGMGVGERDRGVGLLWVWECVVW